MNDLREIVKNEAARINSYMQMDLDAMKADIDSLLQQVLAYGLFNGGKRIRPLLVVASAGLCGMRSDDTYRLGIAFEYLHAATLFHDDIIDGSDTRRGKPAVHKKFDTVAAILAGDFLHAHSMAIVSRFAGARGLESFCRATKGMVDGEFMQLQNAEKHNLSEIDYYHIIMGKTGLLISSACEVGAIYAEAGESRVAALRNYGEHLGCAFQIIDDILDYLGDTKKTGKAVGNDYAEGKMTLPLILAMGKANSADKAALIQSMQPGSPKMTLPSVINLIHKYTGFADARAHAEKAITVALSELEIFNAPGASLERNLLNALGHFVLTRDK